MPDLSQDAKRLLEEAGCFEIARDHIVIGGESAKVVVPLTRKAVVDLNRQAYQRAVDEGQLLC